MGKEDDHGHQWDPRHARRLKDGDKAELEAAQKAAEYERQGEKRQAVDWRHIQAAIKELRGPHAS